MRINEKVILIQSDSWFLSAESPSALGKCTTWFSFTSECSRKQIFRSRYMSIDWKVVKKVLKKITRQVRTLIYSSRWSNVAVPFHSAYFSLDIHSAHTTLTALKILQEIRGKHYEIWYIIFTFLTSRDGL